MATALSERLQGATQRFVLHDIDWEGYQSLLKILGDQPVRVTYDRGTLELMTPLPIHERYKSLFGRLIETLTEELDMDLYSFGSTTLGREVIGRGLEPDECFYISSARKIRDPKNIDLELDPPPDLAIEIDITSNSGRRLGIYAALNIPEVWQFDGELLTVLRLQDDGSYRANDRSEELPFLPMAEIAAFVREYQIGTDTQWAKAFRRWVRETIVPEVEKSSRRG
jgi:Uma2 family endonuclease